MVFRFRIEGTGDGIRVRWLSPYEDNAEVRSALEGHLLERVRNQDPFRQEAWSTSFTYHPVASIRCDGEDLSIDRLMAVRRRLAVWLTSLWVSHDQALGEGETALFERARRMCIDAFKELVAQELAQPRPRAIRHEWFECDVVVDPGGDARPTIREFANYRRSVIALPLLDASDPFWPVCAQRCREHLMRNIPALFSTAASELVVAQRDMIRDAERTIASIAQCTSASRA